MAYETASNQRKELIASTLKELLQTKPLSKISGFTLPKLIPL